MNSKILYAVKALPVILIALPICILSCKQGTKIIPPELGAKSVRIPNLHGFQFKDLNNNGELNKYEDWRLSADERSKDILSKMAMEEKA